MKVLAVLFLAVAALARPQQGGYSYSAPTSVTERTYTIRPEVHGGYSQQGYSQQGYSQQGYASQPQGYSQQVYASQPQGYSQQVYASQPQSYSQQVYASQPQVYSQGYSYNGYAAAAPSPVVQHYAYPVETSASYQAVAPVVQTVQAVAPAVTVPVQQVTRYAAVAPVAAAPVVAAVAPVSYQNNFQYGSSGYDQGEYENTAYHGVVSQSTPQGETKVYKHVYAFAAPEEPSQRARVVVQAPVSKRKHYKLVFIKAPSQQTVVDSDITLPAQEEEKTLIYVLSKNQKQLQPEIRIKQAEATKHAKPDVYFLKYKNEAEAQAIANGAVSGQTSGVPANAELISDGSLSVLGQGGAYDSVSAYKQSGFSGVGSSQYSTGSVPVSAYSTGSVSTAVPVSAYSSGSVGVVPTAGPVSTVSAYSTPVPVQSAYSTPQASIGERTTIVRIAEGPGPAVGAGVSRSFNAEYDSSFARSAVSGDEVDQAVTPSVL